MSKIQTMQCPLCSFPLEIDIEWAMKNGRVFCGTCCKSFDVGLKEDPKKVDDWEDDGGFGMMDNGIDHDYD